MLLSVYLPSLVMTFGRGLLLPVMPVFADSFGAPYSVVGLVLAGESIGMLLADVPTGTMLRRTPPRTAMVTGVLIVGASLLALSFVTAVWQVFVLQLVSGVGGALWNVSRHAYLTTGVSQAQRGRAIALFGGVMRLGLFAGPAAGGYLASAYGLRVPFGVVAALALIAALLAARFTERTPPKEAHPQHTSPLALFWSYRQVLLTAGLGQLFAQMVRSGRHVIVPLYGSAVLGLSVESIGLVMSAAALADLLMVYPAGQVMDRWGRKRAIVPSFAVQGLGMLLIPFAGSFWALLLVASGVGLANGLSSGSMMTLGSDLAPPDALGEFLGVWRLVGDVGSMGGPVAVGAVADILTLESAALVLGVVGLTAAAVFAFGVSETRQEAKGREQASL